MNTAVTLILVLAACAHADDVNSDLSSEVARQKRLLFFDEGGSLVNTYPNPYMNKLSESSQNLPNYGNFLNPFFNFIRHFGNSLVAYTIPVSEAIIQSIKQYPEIRNTLVMIPKKDLTVAPNRLCEGKRTQIPSPNLCNNFLNCWDGWGYEQECPAGLLFSNHGYCDYADNVDCHNRILDAGKPQPQPMCSKDFEAFRNQENCNEFFICVNRQPVRFQCPADLFYSQILGVCDYADRVDCKSSGIPIAPGQQPSYPTPIPSPIGPVIPAFPPVSADTPFLPGAPLIPTIPTLPPTSTLPTVTGSLLPESPTLLPTTTTLPPVTTTLPPVTTTLLSTSASDLPTIPQSPTIPPAPAAIPPLPSLLPPGSVFPLPVIPPSHIYPAQKPVPPVSVFPAPVPEGPSGNKLPFPNNIFLNPGCSCANNIAMSRQDAIRLLQQSMPTKI